MSIICSMPWTTYRDPSINPYAIAEQFVYHPRWTASHFGVHRDLVRAMCIDSAAELQGRVGGRFWNRVVRRRIRKR